MLASHCRIVLTVAGKPASSGSSERSVCIYAGCIVASGHRSEGIVKKEYNVRWIVEAFVISLWWSCKISCAVSLSLWNFAYSKREAASAITFSSEGIHVATSSISNAAAMIRIVCNG